MVKAAVAGMVVVAAVVAVVEVLRQEDANRGTPIYRCYGMALGPVVGIGHTGG